MKTFKTPVSLICGVLFTMSIFSITAQNQPIRGVQKNKEIVVVKADNPDVYSSTLDFDDARKQLIMAGQNYNTNYGIYASIKSAPSPKGKNYRTLEKVVFEIVNYKPTYFIGIDSVVIAENLMKNGIMFKIYTRGLSENKTFELNKNVLANVHFEKGSYLHSERTLNPLFVKLDSNGKPNMLEDGRVDCKPDNGQVFDFEFWYKDGNHVVRKQDYDKEQKNYEEELFSLPGHRCKESYNRIIFSE